MIIDGIRREQLAARCVTRVLAMPTVVRRYSSSPAMHSRQFTAEKSPANMPATMSFNRRVRCPGRTNP